MDGGEQLIHVAGAARVGPIAPAERIDVIDILRGFALFGILLVNMRLFSFPVQNLLIGNGEFGTLADSARMLGAPVLALSYIAGLTLLLQYDAWRARLRPLAAVGRMALANYLLQSLIATTLFYGYGIGLFGQVGPAVGVCIMVAIFTIQIPLSVWWMGRFHFGPVEWLWRTLTYLRLQPVRLRDASER